MKAHDADCEEELEGLLVISLGHNHNVDVGIDEPAQEGPRPGVGPVNVVCVDDEDVRAGLEGSRIRVGV